MKVIVSWYNVTDMDKAKAFYGQTLGLEKTFEMGGWAEFGHSKDGVTIGLAAAEKAPAAEGGATVVLGVQDIQQSVAGLKKRGVGFEGDIQEIPGVVKLATFRDPFGNRLQLAQSLLPA